MGFRRGNLLKPLPFCTAATIQSAVFEHWTDFAVYFNALNRARHSAVICISLLQAFEKEFWFPEKRKEEAGRD